MRDPQIITGARTGVADPPPELPRGVEGIPPAAILDTGDERHVAFVSRGRNYIINLGGTKDRYDDLGRVIPGDSYRLVFEDYRCVLELDEAGKKTLRLAETSDAYRKDFWKIADLRKTLLDRKATQAKSYLDSLKAEDPETFERLVMESIGDSGGFKLPNAKDSKKS